MKAYVHINRHRKLCEFSPSQGTIAVECPPKAYLNTVFTQHATALYLEVGASHLHPHDNFNKMIGRQIAASNLIQTVCHLKNVEIRGTKHVYHLSCSRDGYAISLGLSTVAESDTVKLVYASFERNA